MCFAYKKRKRVRQIYFKTFIYFLKYLESLCVDIKKENAAAPDADAAHDGSLLSQQRHY